MLARNEWTMADFCVMMVTVDLGPQHIVRSAVTAPDSSLSTIHHDPSQTADRVKFTLVTTATSPATHGCTLPSHITVVLGSIRLESC
ncbi:hypothetical protein TNCV_4104691 [Trichonephila clavipes]|nr:hypothetical protein TNCV_4104691 [Trichonephila clavipes]